MPRLCAERIPHPCRLEDLTVDLTSFLLDGANLPFAASGVFLAGLLILEIIGVLAAGAGPSHFLDAIDGKNHELHLGDVAADALGYLHWGKVPMIVLLSLLSGLFSLSGLALQSGVLEIFGRLMPGWMASIPAMGCAVVGTHFLARPLARLMPKDSGDALGARDLLGLVGQVSMGPVSHDMAGEARVRDLTGTKHIVRIRAKQGLELKIDDEIVLVAHEDSFYTAVHFPDGDSETASAETSVSNTTHRLPRGAKPRGTASAANSSKESRNP